MELQLQRFRKLAGLNQQEMADALGVKKRTYGSWEREENGLSFEQACMCANVLNCTTDALAGRELPSNRYTDQRQTDLNDTYEALTDEGKDAALGAVRGIKASESARVKTEGASVSERAG